MPTLAIFIQHSFGSPSHSNHVLKNLFQGTLWFLKLPENKSPELDGLPGEFYQTFREELTPTILKLLQKMQKKECFQRHLQGQHHTDSKTRQRYYKKKKMKERKL